MILIDTNVISEVMRISPSLRVLEWLNQQDAASLYISTITIGEIEYGLRILPAGKRRLALKERFKQFIERAFTQRVLVYDKAASNAYGDLMGYRRELGRPMNAPDGQIAAIARAGGLAIATHNTRDFEDCGVNLIDPFSK